jgi:outer membrane protein
MSDRRRRVSRLGWVLGLLVAGSVPAQAADLRVGYIDSIRIFQEYTAAKDAQARFDRQVQSWRDEASEKEKAVNQLRAEVRDQAPILSALRRQEREEALQKAISEYEGFVQEIWGPQGRAQQENERMTGEVVARIRGVVERLAGDKGLTLVFDSAGGFLIYADKSLDLTGEVIQTLNASAEGTGGTR